MGKPYSDLGSAEMNGTVPAHSLVTRRDGQMERGTLIEEKYRILGHSRDEAPS